MIKVAGLELEHYLINAAGTCKTVPEVRRFAVSSVSAVVCGSHTLDPRPVPSDTAYWSDPRGRFSMNALLLPSGGISYLKRYLPAMVGYCHAAGKPFILNIAGFVPEEFEALARLAVASGVDGLEVNLSCPTVRTKIPICYRREETALVGNAVSRVVKGKIPILYKLAPILDAEFLAGQVELLLVKDASGFVLANSYAGGVFFARGRKSVLGNSAYGGVSGAALLPIGLGMVYQVSSLVPMDVSVIGVGGISCWADVQQYLWAGADAVQVGTAYWEDSKNPRVYQHILSERDD